MAGASTTWPGEREIESGKEIVGQTVGKLRQQIRRCRGDHQQLVIPRDGDVFNRAGERFAGAGLGEEAGDHFLTAESGEGERLDKFLRAAGHHHLDGVILVLQGANQLRCFIGGNAAAHSQHNAHKLKSIRWRRVWRQSLRHG